MVVPDEFSDIRRIQAETQVLIDRVRTMLTFAAESDESGSKIITAAGSTPPQPFTHMRPQSIESDRDTVQQKR